jgi:DNA-binding MarR family transcriptional regulator
MRCSAPATRADTRPRAERRAIRAALASRSIARRPEPRDRRGILIELTDGGAEVLTSSVREQAALESRLVGGLTAEEKQRLNDLLRTLLRHFQELLGPPPRRRHPDD